MIIDPIYLYAIPYEGEEVKLHWANHDQYYIKSSENFKNYSFKTTDGKKITFQLKEVSTAQNNNKTQADPSQKPITQNYSTAPRQFIKCSVFFMTSLK